MKPCVECGGATGSLEGICDRCNLQAKLAASTLVVPDGAQRFFAGMAITMTPVPRWYVRAWRWVKYLFVDPPKPKRLVVTEVDREAGVITVSSE